jgi:hypothetical protein
MPALTRRRYRDAREECWHIYFGDVHAGTVGLRTGVPHAADPWAALVGSIRARIRGNAPPVPPPPSTTLAPVSKPLGACF